MQFPDTFLAGQNMVGLTCALQTIYRDRSNFNTNGKTMAIRRAHHIEASITPLLLSNSGIFIDRKQALLPVI